MSVSNLQQHSGQGQQASLLARISGLLTWRGYLKCRYSTTPSTTKLKAHTSKCQCPGGSAPPTGTLFCLIATLGHAYDLNTKLLQACLHDRASRAGRWNPRNPLQLEKACTTKSHTANAPGQHPSQPPKLHNTELTQCVPCLPHVES